ncbi:ABC transporter substrate-binding protein [Gracilibacillus phocaeensis]|uniref:ABC transporter substrate-binding protein n=1 Tax=Gracilibacillus phocaeensis TaxID=2042304 RepID=UPI0010318A0E|nr:sugar ABC transporter substrate-binding protein [Gracilibacillus phocaeensis]
MISNNRMLIVVMLLALSIFMVACNSSSDNGNGGEENNGEAVKVATVNNPDMVIMEELSSQFTEETGIEVEFTVLPEEELRQKVTQDINLGTDVYDVVTASNFNIPTWAEQGHVESLETYFDSMTEDEQAEYDRGDLIEPVLDSVTYNEELYGLPFYSESMMLFYRKDLFDDAGLEMPDEPTWDEVREFAVELHDPSNNMNGIVLRGLTGWGQNMVIMNPILNAFGARWYDEDWNAQFETPEMKAAFEFYKDILSEAGQPEPVTTGYTEALALMSGEEAAMWMDASVSGATFESEDSNVQDKIGYAKAPSDERGNTGGIGGWALALTSSSENKENAFQFLTWVTSKAYIDLIAEEHGWEQVLPGTRESTYQNEEYLEAAPFAEATIDSMRNATYNEPAVDPVPYRGALYLQMPEYADLGTQISQELAAYLAGQKDIDETLAACQRIAEELAVNAGYK